MTPCYPIQILSNNVMRLKTTLTGGNKVSHFWSGECLFHDRQKPGNKVCENDQWSRSLFSLMLQQLPLTASPLFSLTTKHTEWPPWKPTLHSTTFVLTLSWEWERLCRDTQQKSIMDPKSLSLLAGKRKIFLGSWLMTCMLLDVSSGTVHICRLPHQSKNRSLLFTRKNAKAMLNTNYVQY